MLQVDITVWMIRREKMAPVVWGKIQPMFEREVLGDNQVSVTLQVLTTMGEWVQVGMLKGVPGLEKNMENEADHVLKVGLEVEQAA